MRRYVLGTAVVAFAAAGLVVVQTAVSAKPTQTTICHRTLSAKKPYVRITVTKSVLKGHIAHPGDIIPAPPACPTTVLAPSKGGRKLETNLTGPAEVPGPGDPDGTGKAELRLRKGQGQICAELNVSNITLPALGAHIHQAPVGVAGPIVVTLPTPDADGMVEGCVAAGRPLVEAILANPAGYYVNVHTSDYPAGAIRGQLG